MIGPYISGLTKGQKDHENGYYIKALYPPWIAGDLQPVELNITYVGPFVNNYTFQSYNMTESLVKSGSLRIPASDFNALDFDYTINHTVYDTKNQTWNDEHLKIECIQCNEIIK